MIKGINMRFLNVSFFTLLILWAQFTYAAPKAVYNLMATESRIIKFDRTLKRALISNPELASVKVLNSRELLISGKLAGKTELIIWYKNSRQAGRHVVLNISPDSSRREEIRATVAELISELDPSKSVTFSLKNIWIDSGSSIRRELDNLGNQIDADEVIKSNAGENSDIQQDVAKAGSLSVKPIAGNYLVVLKGSVPYQSQKSRIQSVISALGLSVINLIKVSGNNQVKLSVRIAEVVKGNPFKSGIAVRDKRDRFGIFPPGNLGTSALFNVNNQVPVQAGMAFPHPNAFQLGFNAIGADIFGVLSVLEGHNLARVLAKPELVVQSGKSASFLVGGEVPMPVSQDEGTITVSFKEYGVRLRFSPVITSDGKIQLTVAPEVSNIEETSGISLGTVVIPGFKSRKVNTTITLEPGQSFIIGGLLQDSIRSQVSQVPILGSIPILGALFRSTSYEHDKSELAIMVTPSLVEAIKKGVKVKLPGEGIKRASDFDAFFLGKVADIMPEGESALPKSLVRIGLETVE